MVNHARAVEYRLLEICRAAKDRTQAGKERLKTGYARLLDLGRSVLKQATGVIDRLAGRAGEKLRVTGDILKALGAQATLEHFVPLVQRVVAQARERVFEGNTREVAGDGRGTPGDLQPDSFSVGWSNGSRAHGRPVRVAIKEVSARELLIEFEGSLVSDGADATRIKLDRLLVRVPLKLAISTSPPGWR